MLHGRLARRALLVVAACLLLPTPGSAQIGGFIKKKIKQAVKGDSAAAAQESKAAPSGPVFDEYVLELNSKNLDRLEKAVAADKAFRDSARAAHARDMTQEQYDKCLLGVMRSPEALALSKNAPSDMAGVQKQQTEMNALNKKKCGERPVTYDPKADVRPAAQAGARAAGLTAQQYAILKERIGPFCASPGRRVKGTTEGMDYVYTQDEVAALQPRCSALTALLATVSARAAGGAAGPKFEGDVIEVTPDVLAKLEKYYSIIDAQAAAPKKLPPTREQKQAFNQCAQQYMMSPEGRAAMQSMAQSASASGGGQDMAANMKAALEKKCGPAPDEGGANRGPSRDEAARSVGLTTSQIHVMEERIAPICSTINAEPGKPFSAGMQRAFTQVELKALTRSCATLGPLVDKHIGR